ncbi:hypothetical protein CDL15_Pgr002195 [Punica granatum]|uniref:RING-type E3 ubiquitin transferase n=1 Tax=Punica granatum TaxID=22663 RepID=A0A218XD18_PUNGR|nr:hypothetical protein CDL15_Pgr002195 [Punica granatum]
MKFEEMFTEYLHGDQERFLDKYSHVEYKRLKEVLKSCRSCKHSENSCSSEQESANGNEAKGLCQDDQQLKLQEGRVLIQYITINAIAIRKILKKYDKVHGSTNGENFRSKMRAKHLELLQSPWLIELGAFFMNIRGSNAERSQGSNQYSFDFDAARPVMTMSLLESAELEYDLTCAICLDTVFNPYALSCGHLFCKLCARSAASMMIFQGLKAARVYANSVHMLELNLLLKNRCKEYWKERMIAERAEIVKQYKEYCDFQTKYAIGHQLLL